MATPTAETTEIDYSKQELPHANYPEIKTADHIHFSIENALEIPAFRYRVGMMYYALLDANELWCGPNTPYARNDFDPNQANFLYRKVFDLMLHIQDEKVGSLTLILGDVIGTVMVIHVDVRQENTSVPIKIRFEYLP